MDDRSVLYDFYVHVGAVAAFIHRMAVRRLHITVSLADK